MSSFNSGRRSAFTSRLRTAVMCFWPFCFPTITFMAGSVEADVELLVPEDDADSNDRIASVAEAVEDLLNKPVSEMSQLLGETVETTPGPMNVSSGVTRTIVYTPPSPPSPPPKPFAPPPPSPPPQCSTCQRYFNGANAASDYLCIKPGELSCYPIEWNGGCLNGMLKCHAAAIVIPVTSSVYSGTPEDRAGIWADKRCRKKLMKGKCHKRRVQRFCAATCRFATGPSGRGR